MTYHAERAADTRLERQRERLVSGTRWSRKHGRACPECGSHNGMRWHIADGFEALSGESVYRRPGNAEMVFTPCPYCKTDAAGYQLITSQEET